MQYISFCTQLTLNYLVCLLVAMTQTASNSQMQEIFQFINDFPDKDKSLQNNTFLRNSNLGLINGILGGKKSSCKNGTAVLATNHIQSSLFPDINR